MRTRSADLSALHSQHSLFTQTPPPQQDVKVDEVEALLIALGLAELVPVFMEEQIDMESLVLLSTENLALMGIKLGPRVKILSAAAKLRNEQTASAQ